MLSWQQPPWTRPFVEEPKLNAIDDAEATQARSSTFALVGLICCCTLGLAFTVASSFLSWQCAYLAALWAAVTLYLLAFRPRTVSPAPGLLLLTLAGLQSGLFYVHVRDGISQTLLILDLLTLATVSLSIVVLLNTPFRDQTLSCSDISKVASPPDNSKRSPEDNLTLWQWMSVSWMAPLIKLGREKKLHPADVWKLPYEFQHAHLHDAFRTLKGSVLRRLIIANWIDLALLTVLTIVETLVRYSVPLLLQQLFLAMNELPDHKSRALLYAALAFVFHYVANQLFVVNIWYSRRCYERSRGEMITMIFEKTLHRKMAAGLQPNFEEDASDSGDDASDGAGVDAEPSVQADEQEPFLSRPSAADSASVARWYAVFVRLVSLLRRRRRPRPQPEKMEPAKLGKILNIMRGDAYEVAQRFWDFPFLVEIPIGTILSFAYLWHLLGWASLIGLAIVALTQALTAILAKVLVAWETKRRKASDRKLQQISQYVEAIRHLRYYAWQQVWLDHITEARQHELNLMIITKILDTAISVLEDLGSEILPVAAFWAYTKMMGGQLTVDVAFPALELFSLLQNCLLQIPSLIRTWLNAYVAMGRITAYMNEPNKDETDNEHIHLGENFEMRAATCAWPGFTNPVLSEATITFRPGLTVIHGAVASGKSALLQALLGELDVNEGLLIRPSSPVAYCSQTPWLQSMSIRENILFGTPYLDDRYKATLHACALTQDLASFQHGDLSPIGENGIGLSGGQKMRVALARAVYSHNKILLLDDPLSALDQQTAEHIVRECFRGRLLEDRTVILATHRVDLCIPLANQTIELKHGRATCTDISRASEVVDWNIQNPTLQKAHDESNKHDASAVVLDRFEEDENTADGGIQVKVYWEYIRAAFFLWWLAVFMASVSSRVINFGESWYLKEWSEAYKNKAFLPFSIYQQVFALSGTTPISRWFDGFPNPSTNPDPWLIGLLIIVLLQVLGFAISNGFTIALTYTAGKTLFHRVMKSISHATFRYYDVTPTGRLMNRLTGDMNAVDGGVSNDLLHMMFESVAWSGALIVIASVTPSFLAAVSVITVLYVYIILLFIPTSQSLRRLEMVSLSPLMSDFGALLEGLSTVRAFGAQEQFQQRIIATTDAFQQMDHFYWSLQAWLSLRFGMLSAAATAVLTLIAIYSGLSAGLTAFMLVAAEKLVESTQALCQQYGHLQLEFVSVERVVEMLHLDQEPAGDQAPPAAWPSTKDDIVFDDVTVRYAPHLEPSLSELSFRIPGGSSTAMIGRTGSGKSTLALALLATTEPSKGTITIGGIDIFKVDKQALRSRITFLAQDPMLFEGSLRLNLDPDGQHSDAECLSVIERVCGTYSFTLDTIVDSGGKNLSQGQRQLVGLARALLRRSSIVIMDEATASIDRETAWEIQRVVREELAGSTVITIAHRPSAVRGADLCIRLAAGKLDAMGRPAEIVPSDGSGSNGNDEM